MITLHPYQQESVDELHAWFKRSNRALLVAPPGIGKTIKAAAWSARYVKKGRGLFLCHENRILDQAVGEFRSVLGNEVTLGVFHGERKVFDEVDICFASFQTLRHWKYAFFPDEFRFVIVDEGHHAGARTFRPVVEYFKPRYLLGMTATPDRMDDVDIRDIFGPAVVNISLEEAMANNWLAPFEYYVITDNIRTSTLRRLIREEFGENRRVFLTQLNESVFVRLRDEQVAQRIMAFDKKTIIFCERIEHAEHFSEFIPGSRPYHSRLGAARTRETLESFRRGELQYILAVNKLNEGVDIPDAEVIVFYRNTDSERIFLQQLGRGARKRPGKEKYIVLDFVANVHRLLALKEMAERIRGTRVEKEGFDRTLIHLTGSGFDFRFTEEQLSLLEVVERLKPKHISEIPKLAAEYSDKNPLPPEQVIAGTNQKLWWKCSKCYHEWQAQGSNRMQGTGCPACANLVVTATNNLAITHPELVAEYSPRNPLPADKVVAGTGKKLWWICRTCGHEWQASGNRRVQGGGGCVVCTRVRHHISPFNNLAITHPELAKEYSDKNELPADKVGAWTRRKLWWKCTVCKFEWRVAGRDRISHHTGCPACSGRVATSTRNLALTHPELAIEYSPRNPLPADKILAGTNQKLWWKCSKCGYEWQAPGSRRIGGGGCPACANLVVTATNNLAITHPELVAEYSPRNPLPADKVVAGTGKKLWWICRTCGHEWQASGNHRHKGTGCPSCKPKKIWATRRARKEGK